MSTARSMDKLRFAMILYLSFPFFDFWQISPGARISLSRPRDHSAKITPAAQGHSPYTAAPRAPACHMYYKTGAQRLRRVRRTAPALRLATALTRRKSCLCYLVFLILIRSSAKCKGFFKNSGTNVGNMGVAALWPPLTRGRFLLFSPTDALCVDEKPPRGYNTIKRRARRMIMQEASRLILGLRSAGWDEKRINDFILWIETGEEKYKPKDLEE